MLDAVNISLLCILNTIIIHFPEKLARLYNEMTPNDVPGRQCRVGNGRTGQVMDYFITMQLGRIFYLYQLLFRNAIIYS